MFSVSVFVGWRQGVLFSLFLFSVFAPRNLGRCSGKAATLTTCNSSVCVCASKKNISAWTVTALEMVCVSVLMFVFSASVCFLKFCICLLLLMRKQVVYLNFISIIVASFILFDAEILVLFKFFV